jgi:hypothetical protein
MFILGRQPVEIVENCEGFVASTKRKFLYLGKKNFRENQYLNVKSHAKLILLES